MRLAPSSGMCPIDRTAQVSQLAASFAEPMRPFAGNKSAFHGFNHVKSNKQTEGCHGSAAKFLHWSTTGLIAYGYLTGVDDVSDLADPARFRTELIFASLLGSLLVARFLWMHLINGHTRLSAHAPHWERTLSRFAHYGMYVGVAAVILSGFAIGLGISLPGLGGSFVSTMIAIHEFLLAVTAMLMAAHVLGALWHLLIRRDGVWGSMMPVFVRKKITRWNRRL